MSDSPAGSFLAWTSLLSWLWHCRCPSSFCGVSELWRTCFQSDLLCECGTSYLLESRRTSTISHDLLWVNWLIPLRPGTFILLIYWLQLVKSSSAWGDISVGSAQVKYGKSNRLFVMFGYKTFFFVAVLVARNEQYCDLRFFWHEFLYAGFWI